MACFALYIIVLSKTDLFFILTVGKIRRESCRTGKSTSQREKQQHRYTCEAPNFIMNVQSLLLEPVTSSSSHYEDIIANESNTELSY